MTAVYIHKTPSPKVPENEVSQFFPKFPKVEGYKVAYVVYEKPKSLDIALANKKEGIVPKGSLFCGFKSKYVVTVRYTKLI